MTGTDRATSWAIKVYIGIFLVYLLFPLAYMLLIAFNTSRIPTHQNFQFTLEWFAAAWANQRMIQGLRMSLLIGAVVVVLAIGFGLAGAFMLVRLQLRAKSFLYAVLVSPILAPGIVLGISAFIFWSQQLGFRATWWTAALAQCSFIAAYCMLIFIARLQRFDTALEEAALDLGATPRQVFWRITLPYLRPAMLSAAALAFLQSFENYTTTYFAIGAEQTFTIFIANSVRQGVTPAVNAVAFVIVAVTILIAVLLELNRRRAAARAAIARRLAEAADAALSAGVAATPAAARS